MGRIVDGYLWVDLETTGLELELDEIVEVGWVFTDCEFRPLEGGQAVVVPGDDAWRRLLTTEPVRKMHEENGLLAALKAARAGLPNAEQGGPVRTLGAIDAVMTRWLLQSGWEKGQVVLAGSGVSHFDQKWMARYLPRTSAWFHYAPLDVGQVRRFFETTWPEVVAPAEVAEGNHRALVDITAHHRELLWYVTQMDLVRARLGEWEPGKDNLVTTPAEA